MNTMSGCEHCDTYEPKKGAEAEDLRSAIEELIKSSENWSCGCVYHGYVSVESLQRMLDEVDARDSLKFLEEKEHNAEQA